MSDERLRDLERRWRASGSRADELAFLGERIRSARTENERRRFTIEAFAPELARAELVAFLTKRLPLSRRKAPFVNAWQGELCDDVDAFVATELVPWLDPAIAPHRFVAWGEPPFLYDTPPGEMDVTAGADNILRRFEVVRRYHLALLDLLDLPLPFDELARFDEALRAALLRITDFVVQQTACDDDWYLMVSKVFALFLEGKQVRLPEETFAELRSTTLRVHFDSWIAPSPERVRIAAEETSLAIVRAMFDQRYGRE